MIAACRADGVAIGGSGNRVRLVTHIGVDQVAADKLVASLTKHLSKAALSAYTEAEVPAPSVAKL